MLEFLGAVLIGFLFGAAPIIIYGIATLADFATDKLFQPKEREGDWPYAAFGEDDGPQ